VFRIVLRVMLMPRCNLDHAICSMSLCYLCKYFVILYYVSLLLMHLIDASYYAIWNISEK
jgi:hypothetical protein